MPPLQITPTPVPNPASPDQGLLVVEIPESPLAPHMVGDVYYGRTAAGNVPLTGDGGSA